MLVLRRVSGQSITIGNHAEIIIKVLKNENGVVCIGVDAPTSVSVDRLEVYEKRVKNLPSKNAYKDSSLKRLERFEKRLKNFSESIEASPPNDPAMSQDLCSG